MGEKDGDGCGGSGRKEGVRNEEDMKDSEGEGDRDAGKIRPEDGLRQGTGWHGKECWDEEGEGAKIREMVKRETGRWNMQGI